MTKPISKGDQLSKTKRVNPKKMIKEEYHLYVDFVNTKANGICQYCNDNKADDMHHALRGINKDDKSITAICRPCHNMIHSPRYLDIDESNKLQELGKEIASQNWQGYIT